MKETFTSRRSRPAMSLGAVLVVVTVSGCSDDGGTPGGPGGATSTSTGAGGTTPSCPVGGGGAGLPEPRPLGDLTGPWQLFIDDYLIDHLDGVSRSYHPFEKYAENPVMVADQPWEDTYAYVYGRVMPAEDGSGYRMWYSALDIWATSRWPRMSAATDVEPLG